MVTKCDMCKEDATWVRLTQFCGDHFFCTKCAEKEKNFKKEDPSYFFWETIKVYMKRENKMSNKKVSKITGKIKDINYISNVKMTKTLNKDSFQVLAKVELTVIPEAMQDFINLSGNKAVEKIYRTIGKAVIDKIKSDGK